MVVLNLSSINSVRKDMPFLLIHGTADAMVPFDQSVQMPQDPGAGASGELIRYNGGVRNPLVGVGAFDRLQTAHDRIAGRAAPTAQDTVPVSRRKPQSTLA
jgi:hypothetical protein